MAMAVRIDGVTTKGTMLKVWGTFTNGATDSGGNIGTAIASNVAPMYIRTIVGCRLQHTGSSAVADAPVTNTTFPTLDTDTAIITTQGDDGIWEVWGY
jgi:hypothetical protein